jgi:rRNA-processing protein FCF1
MTVSEQINNSTEEIKNLFEDYLLKYSKIYLSNPPDSEIFIFDGDHSWGELNKEGKQLQSKLKDKYSIYFSILKSLLKNQPQTEIKRLEESNKTIAASIEQNHYTWNKNPQDLFVEICSALLEMSQLIDNLYSHNNKYLVIPDTNALLSNPNIEKWNFPEFSSFSIILTPTILSELDLHKINHRNEDVRNKSITLINKIKEYRRRGKLNEGVPIINNKIYLQTLAIEPNMKESLPWLEESNNDDKFLASILEVMRQNSKSNVYLITTDINLQNKAEYSMIPFIEPPIIN